MPAAPRPDNETDRLKSLRRLQVLDTETEACFDRITQLTARLLDVPIAVISLVDEDREWFKACVGTDLTQADRRIAFCAYTILHDETLVVDDARADPRFADNPQVTADGIRFYAGAPLQTADGHNIGALCVKDRRQRTMTAEQIAILEMLAQVVIDELEFRLGALNQAASEALVSSVMESSLTGIMALDSVRDNDGTVVDFVWRMANTATARLIGVDRTTLDCRRFLEVIVGRTGRQLFQRFVEVVDTGVTARFEHHVNQANGAGKPEWLDISAVRLDDGFVVTFDDITQRKGDEQALRDACERATAATRAKGDFLANMSHEVRTPMNAIIGMTDIVLDTPLGEDQRECLQLARSAAESLLTILNDVLDFSKIESGRLELDRSHFSVRDLVGDTLHTLAASAEGAVELLSDIDSQVPSMVVGDAGRLRQVLVNLIGNAIKFTSEGEIVVRVSRIAAEEAGVQLHFEVADTGIGIDASKQSRIFEAFEQADMSTTRTFGGTGLGLAISSHLVRAMNGTMWVDSELGMGSRFHFTTRLEVGAARDIAPPDLPALRVLAVDDNATNLKLLRRMLENWSIAVVTVSDGAAALKTIDSNRRDGRAFDVIMLDCHMPQMDGFTLAGLIRGQRAIGNPVLVMLTSGAGLGDRNRCRELGIESFIMKPLKQSDVLNTLTAIGTGCTTPVVNETPEPAPNPAPEPETVAVPASSGAGTHVLLVEDNFVNQRLALRLLEGRGYTVTVAENGAEAVTLTAAGRFDLILMDLQMPTMGGLEATQRIRADESAHSRHHTPIIAMTAHAMAGDREKCIEAGMDDYLSKPIDQSMFFATLERYSNAPPSISAPQDGVPTLNQEALAERIDGCSELLAELVELFQGESDRLLEEMRDAIIRGDHTRVANTAHALRGAAGSLSGEAVEAAAHRLEIAAGTTTPGALEADFRCLEEELAELQRTLGSLRAA